MEYSTIPRNDAMEFEEVVTMDCEGSSAGMDDDGERPDFRQVAWLLREKLNDIIDGDQGEPPKLELQSLLTMAVSRKIISVDPKMLNPVLWRTLPNELLLLVLARLPVLDIIYLRSLSRDWMRDMATVNSGINQECDKASPTMVAGFSCDEKWLGGRWSPKFFVTICDLSTHKLQYSFRLHPGHPMIHERWDDMGARDGGLVCFVSAWRPTKAKPLCIVVANLLTQVRRKLPPLQYVYSTPPKMMHIAVDWETKCYRVVVVGKNMKGRRPLVEMYDSGTGQWTKTAPPLGSIFGVAYTWWYDDYHKTFRSTSRTQSVYDFLDGKLKSCDEEVLARRAPLKAFWKDCEFVLHWNSDDSLLPGDYCIIKYRIQNNAKRIEKRSYSCSPLEDLSDGFYWNCTLTACEGFLMVFPYSSGSRTARHFWLLDLSTEEWRSLPNCFARHDYTFLMSQASWNVVP